MNRMRTGIALFLFVVSFGLVIRESASAHPTPPRTWVFHGVLTFSSGILLCIFVHMDEVASNKNPKLRKNEPNGFVHAAAVVIGLAQILSICSGLAAGWDSLGSGVKFFFLAIGLILVVTILILIGYSVSQRVKNSPHVIQVGKTTVLNHSATLALLGIGSFLVFSFAMREAFRAHNALSRSRAPSLFLRRDSAEDMKALLEAQNYSSDRMFWAFIALVALCATVGCLYLKRKK